MKDNSDTLRGEKSHTLFRPFRLNERDNNKYIHALLPNPENSAHKQTFLQPQSY